MPGYEPVGRRFESCQARHNTDLVGIKRLTQCGESFAIPANMTEIAAYSSSFCRSTQNGLWTFFYGSKKEEIAKAYRKMQNAAKPKSWVVDI